MITILLVLGVFTFLYLLIKPNKYWEKKNVPTGKVIPVFGDNLSLLLGKESFTEVTQKMYNRLPNARYVGCYQFTSPILVVRSPELIKQICVKDFEHFLNHKVFVPDGAEELFSKNLFSLKGQAWKNMRSTLSPSFTGSKMKSMFILICHKANLFTQYFIEKGEKTVEVEFKDAYSRYTNDVIASTAFGIEVDSLKDRNNEFYTMGSDASNFSTLSKKIVFFFYQVSPALSRYFQIPIFGKKVKTFFMNLVKDTIKMREEQNIKRPDILGLLMEARKGQQEQTTGDKIKETNFAAVEEHLEGKQIQQNLTDVDITSQVFLFFLGGFETVSTAMCFMAYELATNPDVQKKLIEEIDENRPDNGPPSYESVVNMVYMDMVISETLRKWPAAAFTDRTVTKPYIIQPELPNEQPVNLDVGDNILVPIFGIHHDPKYYENPEKFDPDRFSLENRKNIDPYTYLPFGVGPRNCIGSRFALLELKAVFFYLLSHFEIIPVEKTKIPLKISKKSINLTSENNFPLALKLRV